MSLPAILPIPFRGCPVPRYSHCWYHRRRHPRHPPRSHRLQLKLLKNLVPILIYQYEGRSFCQEKYCAHPMWADGCEACMCFNNGNAAWCDGLRGHYYDKYFEEHGENPWGDTNVRNRKCNTCRRHISCI